MKLRDITLFQSHSKDGLQAWSETLMPQATPQQKERLLNAATLLLKWNNEAGVDLALARQGVFMAQTLAELKLDIDTLIAALCFNMAHAAAYTEEQLAGELSPAVAKLIIGVGQMDAVTTLRADYDSREQFEAQMNNIRKMLLAMVEDIRVVLIKLVQHVTLLEAAKTESAETQMQLARLAREIYAPLANRLGVGHIKWQLEDWAFRYLDPQAYKEISKLIAEKRADRQKTIEEVIETLNRELKVDGVKGEVVGRVKHIYSIWRKMQRKGIQYEEVYDVRAVRVLVDKVSECYAALGTVHRLWKHVPKEFDDYIAQPKPNGYRSLHTAVIGPAGNALEVQIRTHDMHEESELGVCAHWAYKEGEAADQNLQRKINWLRNVLEWQEEVTEAQDWMSELQQSVTEDRVYVFTPKGDVFDLPLGSTPLDFAYLLHTQVGHKTRGAKVNGRIKPLTYQLQTGDKVEILTQNDAHPGRDWVNPDSGFIFTSRARAKVRGWFREQNRDENIAAGKELLDKECHRLDLPLVNCDKIAQRFNFKDGDEVLAAIGRGDLRVSQAIHAAHGSQETAPPIPDTIPLRKLIKSHEGKDDIVVEGVGNLLTQMAGCCNPLPGDRILGYITHGKGVTIHRHDCPNVLNFQLEQPERVLEVNWGHASDKPYPARIVVRAYDRKNLLRDITSILSSEQVNVLGMHSLTDQDSVVTAHITLEVIDLDKLARILDRLGGLPNILAAVREHQEPPA